MLIDMQPIRLKIKDFLSFAELDYSFDGGPVLLVGENRTDEGQENNGSGKTSIQSAIEKCLLDYTSRKRVRDVNLIRRGCSSSTVELWINCPIRKEVLHIKRTLKKAGSNKLELDVNEKPVSFSSVNDGNDFIIKWIGISKEDISNYYIVNKERFSSFFTSSNTQKLQLLGRFSNTSFLDELDTDLKNEVSRLEKKKNDLVFKKSNLEGKEAVLSSQINLTGEDSFEKSKQERISVLQSSIDRNIELIKVKENGIESANEEISKRDESIRSTSNDIATITETIAANTKKLRSIESQVNEIEVKLSSAKLTEKEKDAGLREMKATDIEVKSMLKQIKLALAGVITCPKCGHEFLLNSDKSVAELRTDEKEVLSLEKITQQQIKSLQSALDDLHAQVLKYRAAFSEKMEVNDDINKTLQANKRLAERLETNLSSYRNERDWHTNRIATLNNEISELKKENVLLKKQVKEVSQEKFENSQLLELQQRLDSVVKERVATEEQIESYQSEIDDVQAWAIHFKEFRMYLANMGVKEIQFNCNEILKNMRSDLRVSIDGFKQKADGTLKDEITPTIIRDEALAFDSFSGGERGRLEYAMILAQQKIINATNPFGGLYFLFTDEIAEGIDALGLKLLVDSLNNFSFPILMTTHVINQSVGSHTLKVIKERGISRIEKQN